VASFLSDELADRQEDFVMYRCQWIFSFDSESSQREALHIIVCLSMLMLEISRFRRVSKELSGRTFESVEESAIRVTARLELVFHVLMFETGLFGFVLRVSVKVTGYASSVLPLINRFSRQFCPLRSRHSLERGKSSLLTRFRNSAADIHGDCRKLLP
jgi:hypothetical protein